MKNISIILFFAVFTISNAQTSVNASGGNVSSSSGSVSYSVGQVFSKTFTSANNSIIEGVHQPFEISTLGVDNNPAISLEMKIYPNPTTDSVFLKFGDQSYKGIDYQLYDVTGKLLLKNTVTKEETQIDLSSKNSGAYILVVSNGSQRIKTFKIIKN